LRQEAEKARVEALAAQHEAVRQKETYEQKAAQIVREAEEREELREKRLALKVNDVVRVARFDKTGLVVRVNPVKQTVLVSVGLGQWEVPFDEVFPEPSGR
jgi:DNA mismatch repair protein MutS2